MHSSIGAVQCKTRRQCQPARGKRGKAVLPLGIDLAAVCAQVSIPPANCSSAMISSFRNRTMVQETPLLGWNLHRN